MPGSRHHRRPASEVILNDRRAGRSSPLATVAGKVLLQAAIAAGRAPGTASVNV